MGIVHLELLASKISLPVKLVSEMPVGFDPAVQGHELKRLSH